MSTWQIEIPNRGRGQPIVDALCDAPAIDDPEARAVSRVILEEAAESGVATVGEVLDRLERADPAERRQILDRAREQVGLESTADIAAHAAFEMAQRVARQRVPSTEPPRLAPGGGIEIPLSPAELAAAQREDELRAEQNRQRREQREHDAAERAAVQAAADERWRPSGPGWEPTS